jgi:hypothetical protein
MSSGPFTPRPPEAGFGAAGIPPPAALYIGPDESLVVYTWSSAAPQALTITARVLTLAGLIQTASWTHTPNTDRSLATTRQALAEGFLLSLIVGAHASTYRRGQCWCQIDLQRGEGAAGVVVAELISDYITGTSQLSWPDGQIHQSTERPGLVRSVTGTDPAAGAEITQTVPTGARWRLLGVRAALTTDATAATRQVTLLLDDGTATLFSIPAASSQTASLTYTYNWAPSVPSTPVNALNVWGPLPGDLFLQAGYRIRTSTASFQAGDNWTAPQLLLEEWIEP